MFNCIIWLSIFISGPLFGTPLEKEWPRPPLEIIAEYLPAAPKILEAGAHYGEDTLKMMQMWPDAIIYAFEPHPTAQQILLKTTEEYSNIHTYPFALYTYDGYHPFFLQQKDGNDGASSLFKVTNFWRFFFTDVESTVPCITLNSWMRNYQISQIDFMWLDLEGAELQVLSHGLDLLSTVKVLYVETNFCKFRKNTTLFHELDQFLTQHNFTLLYHVGCPTFQGDAIYVKLH